MSHYLESQNWRYATKKFDATKKISDEDLATLKEAIRLSASSFGLQPYKIIIVENSELRLKLQEASFGQTQLIEASHVIVFANVLNIGNEEIDTHLANIIKYRRITLESLSYYPKMMKDKIPNLPQEIKNAWTSKQTYLAMGNLLNAAADLRIDVTPMEGFEPEKVNEILGLNKLGLNASLIACVGYRHEDDATQHYVKVRKSTEELFITM